MMNVIETLALVVVAWTVVLYAVYTATELGRLRSWHFSLLAPLEPIVFGGLVLSVVSSEGGSLLVSIALFLGAARVVSAIRSVPRKVSIVVSAITLLVVIGVLMTKRVLLGEIYLGVTVVWLFWFIRQRMGMGYRKNKKTIMKQ